MKRFAEVYPETRPAVGAAATSIILAYAKARKFGKARRILQEVRGVVDADGVPVIDTAIAENLIRMMGG